jgi:hypothetical protein
MIWYNNNMRINIQKEISLGLNFYVFHKQEGRYVNSNELL